MPNYEYYRSMYTQTAEKRFQDAISMAYRDLMLQYQNDMYVRNLVTQQLIQNQNALNTAMVDLQTGGRKTGVGSTGGDGSLTREELPVTALDVYKAKKDREETILSIQKYNNDLQTEADKYIKDQYDLRPDTRQQANQFLNDIPNLMQTSGGNLTQLMKDKLTAYVGSLPQGQVDSLFVQYGPQIANKTGASITDVGNAMGVSNPTIGTATLQMQKNFERKQYYDQRALDTNMPTLDMAINDLQRREQQTKDTIKQSLQQKQQQQPELSGSDKLAQSTLPEYKTVVPYEVKPPTIEDVKRVGAQYYAPFANKGFQKDIASRDAFLADTGPVVKEVATQTVKQNLPAYAGNILGVAGEIESFGTKSMDEIAGLGTGNQYVSQMFKTQKSPQEIADSIPQQNLTPEEQKQAYATLGYYMLQDHRKKKQQSNPIK